MQPRRRKQPTLPLFSSGDPHLADKAREMFGGSEEVRRKPPRTRRDIATGRALYAFAALCWIIVALDWSGAIDITRPGATTSDPTAIAECIAEKSYTHPHADPMVELTTAVRLCRLEQGK